MCPSDGQRPPVRNIHGGTSTNYMSSMPNTSYVGNSGSFNNWSDSTNSRLSGGFFTIDPARPSSMASFLDGTSNTVAVSERSSRIWSGGAWLGVQHSTQSPGGGTDAACCQDWFLAFGGMYPITNQYVSGMERANIRYSSDHVGGAHVLLADGAVRFVSERGA